MPMQAAIETWIGASRCDRFTAPEPDALTFTEDDSAIRNIKQPGA